MIHLLIPEEELQKIEEERFNYPDPLIVAVCMPYISRAKAALIKKFQNMLDCLLIF